MVTVALFVVGLCFGSFINALVWRIHEQAKSKNKQTLKPEQLSIVHGRSMCPHCHHTLAWFDLIPLASWLQLRGTCRYCQRPISIQYPLVELLTAVLFIVSYIYWPYSLNTAGITMLLCWFIVVIGMVALVVYDLRWMLLPDRLTGPLIILAVIFILLKATLFNNHIQVLLSALWGVVFLAGLFYVLFQVSKGRWIGGGDVKLGIILGLLVGSGSKALLVIFLASALGSLYSLPLVMQKKLRSRIPFGPFLILATIIVFICGSSLINWYKRRLLLA